MTALPAVAVGGVGALSGQDAVLDYVPGELDRTAPKRIWLQLDTDGDNTDRSEPFPYPASEEVCWCAESIGGLEVQYVRADLAATPASDEAVGDAHEAFRVLAAWDEFCASHPGKYPTDEVANQRDLLHSVLTIKAIDYLRAALSARTAAPAEQPAACTESPDAPGSLSERTLNIEWHKVRRVGAIGAAKPVQYHRATDGEPRTESQAARLAPIAPDARSVEATIIASVDRLLAEAGFAPDSSVRHQLAMLPLARSVDGLSGEEP